MRNEKYFLYYPPKRSNKNVSSLIFGKNDLFITYLYFNKKQLSEGASWSLSNQFLFGIHAKRVQVIFPNNDEKYNYNEFIRLKFNEELKCELAESKNYIIVTAVDPFDTNNILIPILGFDITYSKAWEVYYLFFHIMRLASKSKIFPSIFSKYADNYGISLFKQDLVQLEGAYSGRTKNNVLDVLSMQIHLCPSITLTFIHFVPEIKTRYDSISNETLESKPGALSWEEVLKTRKECEESFYGIKRLKNEYEINDVWK